MRRPPILLGAGALGVLGPTRCQAICQGQVTRREEADVTENEKIIREFVAAWSELNADAIVSYFAVDGVYHNMPAQPVKGHTALRQFISSFIKPWTKTDWEILTLVAQGDVVIAERIDRTVAMGKSIDLPCCGVFEMRNGKIGVWRDYFDMATYTRALQS